MSFWTWPKIFRGTTPSDLEIYTDGSFKQGRGSWAFVMVRDGVVLSEASGSENKTNSLRMEMRAVIEALSTLPENSTVTVYCDCRPVLDLFVNGAQVTPTKPNLDLVNQLLLLNKKQSVDWRWIKAHSGKLHNERCDELCVQARS
jgi:ribonuclease HI